MHMQMEKEMKKRKDIFYWSFTFQEENEKKKQQELRAEKWGTHRVQSRWNICLVYVLWSAFKCVENREI